MFISYRRQDSSAAPYARLIYERVARSVEREKVFLDVDNIPLGLDFQQILSDRVGACDALLAIIGPDWLTIEDEDARRRLDNPDDFVRIEVEAALSRSSSSRDLASIWRVAETIP